MSYESLTSPNGVRRLLSGGDIFVPFSSDHTMMAWYKHQGRVSTSDTPTVFYIGDNPTIYADVVRVRFDATATTAISLLVGSTTIGTWSGYPDAMQQLFNQICYVREGLTHRLYVNADEVISGTQDASGFPAPTHLYLGTDTFAAGWAPHDAGYFREWDRALTLAEIALELNSTVPVRLDHLFVDAPLQTDLLDTGKRGVAVPTGTMTLRGLILDGVEIPAGTLSLAGHAPDIDTFLTIPARALALAGQVPTVVVA